MIRPYHKPGKYFFEISEFIPDIFRSVDILGPSGGFEGTNQSAAAPPAAAPSGGGGSFWDSEPAPAPQAHLGTSKFYSPLDSDDFARPTI